MRIYIVTAVLNEVLSLNAQEYPVPAAYQRLACILNEVLSLNAQEFRNWTKAVSESGPQ